jgi:hypothetical protein
MISGPRPVLLGHLAKVGGYFLGWVYIIYICIHFGSVKSNDFIPAITLRLWVIKVIFPGGYYSVTLPSNSIQSSNLISFVTSRYPTNRYAWSKTLTHTHTDDAQHNMIIYILWKYVVITCYYFYISIHPHTTMIVIDIQMVLWVLSESTSKFDQLSSLSLLKSP